MTGAAAPTRVVLVHGVRTSATMWRAQVATLATHGYEAVAVDLPGHGTRRDEPFTLARACAVLDEAVAGAAGRVVVVGLSLGGYVTLHWAARGGRCDGVVVSSCTALPGTPVHRAFIAISRVIGASGGGADRLSGIAARLAVGASGAVDVGAGGLASAGQAATLTAVLAANPLADLAALEDRGLPLRFVIGEWDHFRLDERAFRAAAPSASWVLVRRANHLVSLHRPRAYGRALLDALEAVSG
ncbi:alpha/beta fold hydrolase [Litorihabitans aurantiacus]|uniref:Lysophospholipase n=1 Tax=Litorihabitans aurantiacus TaxID=1930061 RepID=A0AA37XFN1_9MICO|nr:alpha/beta fold hydrolase [Litorihabitans aurantiacus]GMA32269.1 lysophospholipase [Litorihabitans aurantiacus]